LTLFSSLSLKVIKEVTIKKTKKGTVTSTALPAKLSSCLMSTLHPLHVRIFV
jgi:hypothetical protein